MEYYKSNGCPITGWGEGSTTTKKRRKSDSFSRSLAYRTWFDLARKPAGRVCEEWRNSAEAFVKDMGQKPSSLHRLTLRNKEGIYEKSNCFWKPRK